MFSSKSSVNTSDYQTIIACLEQNVPSFIHLDFSNLHLTLPQLEEIAAKIQNNNFIGNVSWGIVPNSCDELIQKIESKIILNNQNYKHHPNDFVHGLFSLHAYIDSKENDIVKFAVEKENDKKIKIRNEQLEDWRIFKIFNKPEIGRYYAVSYINERTKQMVLAYRGTTFEKLDLLKANSPLKAHLKSILGGQIVAQQAAAYEATGEVTKYANENNYNLSFTGYSIGAWFAELSLYFAHRDFHYPKAKAITFDSPGSAKIMDSFKPNILSHETTFDVKNLNITTYLSAPNFVNVCNPHIHKAYRLFPKITAAEYNSKIINTLNKAVPIKSYITLLSLNGDLLDSMLDSFDLATGKPIRSEKILDWPCIEYDPKDDTLGKKAIDKVLNFIPVGSTIKDLASKLIHRNITATTLGSFLEIIDQLVSGNIASEQFLEIYKHLENNAAQGYPSKEIITSEGKFELSYKGHYRIEEVNLSIDVANTNSKSSSDWYLAQLSKLSIDKKEIPNLIKQQLKVIKELYEIKPQYGKYYIFTNSPNVKVDDLREQIFRLIEVSEEAKEVLEDSNAYTTNESIKVTENIISNLPPLSTYNLIVRNEILQEIEETLNEKRFITVSAFAGTGKSTIAIEYGSKQRDEAKKIVRFINADSADKIFEAYRQLAKEVAIYTIGEKEEDIIRLVHERIANLKPSTLFIFDNVEKYKDIESYLNGIMNMPNDKTQVIITTRNNKLSEDITNIKLKPFNREEAILYLVESLKDRLNKQDISNLLAELSSEDAFILPYSLSKAVAYLKENKLLRVDDYINYFKNSKDDHIETVLLLQLLEKSPLAWLILQCSAHLDPDFISIDIFKELFLVDEEKLQEPIKRLEALSLMNLTYQNGQAGLQLHRLVQTITKQYINKYKEHAIDEKEIYIRLVEVLDNLFPLLTDIPNEYWESAKIFYPHIIKILNDNIKIDNFKKANLYQKLGNYNEYILCKFKYSLKYYKEALKIFQELQGSHPNVANSLNDVGGAYQNLGKISEGLKYQEAALKMLKALYQGNHHSIALSLNNVGVAYGKLGNTKEELKYKKQALNMLKEQYQSNYHDIALCLNSVGLAYQNLGKISDGLKYQELALELYLALYKGNHPDIASSLNNVGVAYGKLGNIKEELKLKNKH
ncbi:hypothetical protein H6P87_00026 [Rickettsia tillamookensis]|uniref:NB-ARC domain-containing protein n=1 Tax=Rickettsia tillamookensis TaxID=2761623 RepID=A0A9E6MG38_9RICK|nr:hypothetical protein H6P87_00026 [Rickettsia tillamookensis]